ncbi:mechanosensitive ion channel family protein [Candidatus Saccharibacteria bacterium]|nr:mechanosensitive ion channel family protein [Candidatus Saccharibacteria bacterium]
MTIDNNRYVQQIFDEFSELLAKPNAFRSVLILMASMVIAYWLSRFLAQAIIRVAQKVSDRSERESDNQRVLRYQQIETYLSMTVAFVRVAVVLVVGYVTWRLISPLAAGSQAANSLAAIGTGTLFVVIAGRTLGVVLQDLTAGATMITEGWFHVGDYVKLEPYMDVTGVVERFTLRSTRIRSLNGEIIWVHNQNITGAHVTPNGVRTQEVEIFLRNAEKGKAAISDIIKAMPKDRMMLPKPLKIIREEKWSNNELHITVVGQTPPGREWLIDDYFMQAIRDIDPENSKSVERILARPPMVHMADPAANRRFQRSVRVHDE